MNTVILGNETITPSKIVCVGRNYVAHIEELGNEIPEQMVVFLKPNSALGTTLHSRLADEALHYECEIAFSVMGGELAAVGFGLDLTKRALQTSLKSRGLPWERAKAFDGAALFSDFVAPPRDLGSLTVELEVDGELRQSGGVELMMYPPQAILREIKQFMTLEDGDLLMTGTPAGVGEVKSGQRFTGRVRSGDRILTEGSWIAR